MRKILCATLLLVALLYVMPGCVPVPIVKGNGNVVTRSFDISDYDRIEIRGGKLEIHYSQSADEPALSIKTDENIFEKYNIYTDGNKLKITPKDEYRKNRFMPTTFYVETNSTGLSKASVSGDMKFNIDGPLHTRDIKFELAGGGDLNVNDSLTFDSMKVEIAGSCKVNGNKIYGRNMEFEVAGSGNLQLAGEADRIEIELAGSGKVRGYEMHTKDLKVEIAGSGNVELSVSNSIKADIAGSGKIRYKGDPGKIVKSVAGSGSIKKAE